jgi:hypothetical protein
VQEKEALQTALEQAESRVAALEAQLSTLLPTASVPSLQHCLGHPFQPSKPMADIYQDYPLAYHTAFPDVTFWPAFRPEGLYLISTDCTGIASYGSTCCGPCASLSKHRRVKQLQARFEHPLPPHTPYQFLTNRELGQVVRRYNDTLDQERLKNLNLQRKVTTVERRLAEHDQLFQAIVDSNVSPLSSIFEKNRRAKRSIAHLLEVLSVLGTKDQVRRTFTEYEFDLATLIYRRGGESLLYTLAQAFGLPAPRTVRDKLENRFLQWSAGYDISQEASVNLQLASSQLIASTQPALVQLMIDEVHLNKKLAWDTRAGMVAGLARESASNCSAVVSTYEDVL